MKKEIRFSSIIDTKEFDRAVEQMQKKLQSVYQASDRSRAQLEIKQAVYRAGLGPAPTAADKAKADQEDRKTRQELDKFIKEQVKYQEALGKTIAKQLEQRKEMLKLAKDTAEIEKQIATNREKMRASEEATMRALKDRQRMGFDGFGGFEGALERGLAAYRGAGRGGAGLGGRLFAAAKGFGRGVAGMGLAGVGGILSATGALINIGASAYDYVSATPQVVLAAQGSAMNANSQGLRDIFSGRGFERRFYAAEEAEARRMAKERREDMEKTDTTKVIGTGVGIVGAGLASGGIGAGIATVGAAIYSLFDSRFRDKALSMMGFESAEQRYKSQMDEQEAQMAAQNLENLKAIQPVKQTVFDRYMQEMMPNLQAQRAMGLSDEALQTFLEQGAGAGFLMQETRASGEAILSAGGSTRAARGLATFANQLVRDKDLTNAQQLIGMLSGAVGSASETESALKKVLTDSVRLGLDKSEFAAENRKFNQMATEIIVRSGARDAAGAGLVSERFSGFVAEKTMAGLEGARSAFSLKELLSSQGGGARGVMQAAALMRNRMFKGLNPMEMSAVMNMKPSEILAGNPEVEALYEKVRSIPGNENLTYEDFKKELARTKSEGVLSPLLSTEKLRNELKAMAQGKTPEQLMQDKEFRVKFGRFRTELRNVTEGFSNLSEQAKTSFAFAELGLIPPEAAPQTEEETVKEERLADKIIKNLADDEKLVLETIKRFAPAFDQATKVTEEYSKKVLDAIELIEKGIRNKDFEMTRKGSDQLIEAGFLGLSKTTPETPPQTKSK
jgi:hypothetical protein